jgi:hypothetical protein
VIFVAIGRVFLTPFPDGILVEVGIEHIIGGGIVLAVALREAVRLEMIRSSEFGSITELKEREDESRNETSA